MQTVASFYPNFAISQTMKSQGRSVLQYNAKQDLILILKNFFYILVIQIFLWQNNDNTANEVCFYSGLVLALFGFLLKLSSGNPAEYLFSLLTSPCQCGFVNKF